MRRAWSDYYFSVARDTARQSRDPSTKCGAVIVRPDKTIAGTGFNGFARGVEDSDERYQDRAFKIACVVHAEENAILNAGGSVRGCDLYVTPLIPCAHCASLIVQAGIKRVFAEAPEVIPDRWRENMEIASLILNEGGVDLERSRLVEPINKPRVVIESPFSGDVSLNISYAKAALHDSLLRGEAPIASHLLIAAHNVLDDTIKGERILGMQAGWAWIERADLMAVYEDRGISQGMLGGINRALELGIAVEYRKLGEEWMEKAA